MNDVQTRLVRCFHALFPDVAADQLPTLTQDSTAGWDSVATATLMALIEEEFGVTLGAQDLDQLESFESVHKYLLTQRIL